MVDRFRGNYSATELIALPEEANRSRPYSHFIEIFQSSYEKCCPVKKVRVDENNGCIKPWFTKGLRNAYRKKNCLYKKFLQNRTDTAEMKYKAYTNKLTSILRNCQKIIILIYSNKKKPVKGTLKILNTIIRKGKRSSNYPDSFTHNGATVKNNKKDIANGFNGFKKKSRTKLSKMH